MATSPKNLKTRLATTEPKETPVAPAAPRLAQGYAQASSVIPEAKGYSKAGFYSTTTSSLPNGRGEVIVAEDVGGRFFYPAAVLKASPEASDAVATLIRLGRGVLVPEEA